MIFDAFAACAVVFRETEHVGHQGVRMRLSRLVFAVLTAVLAPTFVFAQSSINGLVKDSSGALLPGVTVEASSPALIEKVRTAVPDGGGQYHIEDLRPGTYS